MTTPETTHRPTMIIGIVCGTLAALAWAGGFVVAKHGIQVGFSPADLAFHRFFWSGLLMLPYVVRDGLRDLDGVGWGRGFAMSVLSGPPQSLLAYSGFILVPLGHGTTIQPACAALSGLVLASLILHEKPSRLRPLAEPASAAISCLPPPGCSGRRSVLCFGFGTWRARVQ
jgi:drug/metabolite transporter (DMT)-like permease